jgi:hypothetical protein
LRGGCHTENPHKLESFEAHLNCDIVCFGYFCILLSHRNDSSVGAANDLRFPQSRVHYDCCDSDLDFRCSPVPGGFTQVENLVGIHLEGALDSRPESDITQQTAVVIYRGRFIASTHSGGRRSAKST